MNDTACKNSIKAQREFLLYHKIQLFHDLYRPRRDSTDPATWALFPTHRHSLPPIPQILAKKGLSPHRSGGGPHGRFSPGIRDGMRLNCVQFRVEIRNRASPLFIWPICMKRPVNFRSI